MRVDLFDFDLPQDRIALRPARPRESARMLVVRPPTELIDSTVMDLSRFLRPGDVMVYNDSRVIPARLQGVRIRGGDSAAIELTLHTRLSANEWLAFARGAKKLRPGDRVRFGAQQPDRDMALLEATLAEKRSDGEVLVRFDLSGGALDAALAQAGQMPLPPYIAARRPADAQDRADYQTVYAQHDGAVAAPTAGLHFSQELLTRLEERGVTTQFVTLHVGPGTFLPVKAETTDRHRMHAERGEISAATAAALNRARSEGGRIVSVGTTSLRLLESAADPSGTIHPFAGSTDIFIVPGYRFRAVDLLLTNFHLPRSTLFMLVCAFSGIEVMQAAYRHAIAQNYRFYSYGDACLLHPQ